MSIFIFRVVVITIITLTGYFFSPFKLENTYGALVGFMLSVVIIYLETRIRKAEFKVIWSSTLGTFAGVVLGWALGSIYRAVTQDEATTAFIRIFFLIIMPYIGFLVGSKKSDWLYIFSDFSKKMIGGGAIKSWIPA